MLRTGARLARDPARPRPGPSGGTGGTVPDIEPDERPDRTDQPTATTSIVIGGGHNGLVAAGLLAKAGQRVVVLERRETVGGAAITETPWGPDYKMTALSYVVSLMPPTILRELELERHGYRIYPQGPYFAPHRTAATCSCPTIRWPATRRSRSSPPSDADAMEELGRLAERPGRRARPDAVAGPAARSAPSDRAICSTCPAWVGASAASTSARPATSPGCSPRASPTCSTTTSRARSSRVCWRSAA